MTNKEWLEKCKKADEEGNKREMPIMGEYSLKYCQLKALEIIAEELIKLNELLKETTYNGRHYGRALKTVRTD